MPKYYKKKYSKGSRDKYSVEHTAFFQQITPNATSSTVVVPPVSMGGMRKVKHLTVSMSSTAADGGLGLFWALVFVPEGYNPQAFNVPTSSAAAVDLYPANQYVMGCGVIDFDAGPQRISTPLARNLNSGDSIVLLLRQTVPAEDPINVSGVVKYAITLQ